VRDKNKELNRSKGNKKAMYGRSADNSDTKNYSDFNSKESISNTCTFNVIESDDCALKLPI